MSNDRDNEPFLNRWARQKRETKREPPGVEASAPDAPELDLTKLPNVDELTADSDITGFLQKGVPEALQKLALRRMWALDPSIRDFVEMAENQWDFNLPGGIPGLYQDLAEGTDVSVWLAQATQSVVGEEARSRPAAVAENGAVQHYSLQDAPPNESEPIQPAQHRHDRRQDAEATPQVAENTQKTGAVAVATLPLDTSVRRRHGSALPD
jgi:hypothetical protein